MSYVYIRYRRLTYDISRYKRSHTISYTICNSWVLGQAASFITWRAWRPVLPLRTRFSTKCSAISSTTFPSFRTCIHKGLPLPQTSLRSWAPHIQRFRALLLSQRPTSFQRSWWHIWRNWLLSLATIGLMTVAWLVRWMYYIVGRYTIS